MKSVMGRPSKYREEYNDKAYEYFKAGATDEQFCGYIGIASPTFYEWKKKYDEFSRSVKLGKSEANNIITRSLFDRAQGYDAPDRHYPPEVGAITMWLKNREPKEWRDKQTVKFELDTSLSYSDQMKQATKALSTGEIPLEFYNAIISGIEKESAVKHKDELEKRMLELEERLGLKDA